MWSYTEIEAGKVGDTPPSIGRAIYVEQVDGVAKQECGYVVLDDEWAIKKEGSSPTIYHGCCASTAITTL